MDAGNEFRLLFVGDVVGEPGRKLATRYLPILRRRWRIDAIVVNAENAAGGSGLTARCHAQFAQAGVDALTMGDHVYRQREVFDLFGRTPPICRPANFPAEAPGPDSVIFEADGLTVGVVSLLGRTFMKPVDCPFRAADRVLANWPSSLDLIVADVHAEATSEKQLLHRYLSGRAAAVLGTHTHVPTADAHVDANGTAYVTDVGMTGPYDGIIGRDYEKVLRHTLTSEPVFFEVATGDPRLSGALVSIDRTSRKATAVELVHLKQSQLAALADEFEVGA